MTTTTSPPVFSLQAPKDISIDDIEAELRDIWRNYDGGDGGTSATRATTFSFLVYEPESTQHLLTALGFYNGPIDGIAGPRMVAAIKAAQKAYNLEVTGTSNQEFSQRLEEEFNQAKQKGNLSEAKKNAAIQALPDLEGAAIADAIAQRHHIARPHGKRRPVERVDRQVGQHGRLRDGQLGVGGVVALGRFAHAVVVVDDQADAVIAR